MSEEMSNMSSSSEDGSELEDETKEGAKDKDDGLLTKKMRKLACVVSRKSSKNKDEIEPFNQGPKSWIHSKHRIESTEVGGEIKLSTYGALPGGLQSSQCQNKKLLTDFKDCDIYNFNHLQRGYLLLVINEKFYRQSQRHGAHLDLLKMKTVAERLGLRLLNENHEMDLSASETLNWLKLAQSTDHSDCDCFMFMISTHGLEQQNPNKGGKIDHALVCADDRLIFTSTIIEMFNETNCPTLRGKPKIFIIQACRGDDVDHGGHVTVLSDKSRSDQRNKDNKAAKSDHVTHQDLDLPDAKAGEDRGVVEPLADTDAPCLKCDSDMLVMYAVPAGMLAWRNTSDGSWMVHYLHEVFMAYDRNNPRNFLQVLTKVAARMSRRTTDVPEIPNMHEKKAVPVIEHKLTKDILFS